MTSVLIHIGYQKTGSTWLQRCLFPSREVGFGLAGTEDEIKRHIVKPLELSFDVEACRALFAPYVEAVAAEGLVPVLSAERLCGDAHLRGHDSVQNAGRLAALFPDAKVLMIVREQRKIILAGYKQYVSAGGLLPLEEYLAGEGGSFQWPFAFERFEYDLLIRHYYGRFGEENVLALPFELFVEDGRDFATRIVSFAGANVQEDALAGLPYGQRENEARSAASVAAKRRLNLVLKQRLTPWGRLDPRAGSFARKVLRSTRSAAERVPEPIQQRLERRMVEDVAAATHGKYRESNARTAELIGFDLGRWGYELPKAGAERLVGA